MFENIDKRLLAADGSSHSLRAAEYAVQMLKRHPSIELTIVYVRTSAENLLRFTPWVSLGQLEVEINKVASSAMERVKKLFTDEGLEVKTQILCGNVGESIVRYAKENNIGMIIMGTRGESDLAGLILGSVSHQVLHLAKCPVLFVK